MNISFVTEPMLDNTGEWYYAVDSNNDIYLVGYNGSSSIIVVPAIIYSQDSDILNIKGTYGLFNENETITKVEFAEGIEIIGDSTCYECQNLTEVIIPESVIIIGTYVFWNCGLEGTISLPNSLQDIDSGSFCNNYDMREINLPDNLSNATLSRSSIFRNNPNLVILVNATNRAGILYLRDSGFRYRVIGDQPVIRKSGAIQYFLAGVANAEIFKGDNLLVTAKTLIDSSITIGVSAEDIRAGQGAKLYGKYFHTSTFDLKLSDAMFRLEYIAANVGGEISLGGDVFNEEEIIVENGRVILQYTPKPLNNNSPVYIYYKKPSDKNYFTYKVEDLEENSFTINTTRIGDGGEIETVTIEDGIYCIKYLYTNETARRLIVNANFTPDTLSVYLTANLYSGDASNPQTGTKAGTITIKIPRFLLSGSQEISMSMTGAANTPLEGSALATKGAGCDGDGIYAEIIEIITGRTYDDLVELKIKDSDDGLILKVGETNKLFIYGRFNDSYFSKLDNNKLVFTSMLDDCVTVDSNGVVRAISSTYGVVVPVVVTLSEQDSSINTLIGVVVI